MADDGRDHAAPPQVDDRPERAERAGGDHRIPPLDDVANAERGAEDTLGVDDFTLNYSASAIPEPSTYAAIAGGVMLAAAAWKRRRRREPAS